MKSLNSITLTGQLADEPKVLSFSGGTEMLVFRFCFWTSQKESDGWKDAGNFIDVKQFKPSRAFADMLHKGTFVGLSGRLQSEEWQDKNTGAKRSKFVIVAHDINFTVPKSKVPQEHDGIAPVDGYKSEDAPGQTTIPLDQGDPTPF